MADDDVPWFADSRLTADVVLFTRRDDVLLVLAVERGKEPFRGALAIPGGFLEPGERESEAAIRELVEETGIEAGLVSLRRLGCYWEEGRDPRGRVVSAAFHGYVAGAPAVVGGSDARAARWVAVRDFLSADANVAFDHQDIVRDAVASRFESRTSPSPAGA